ncbi:hypothetical protein CERSUDRAFT_67981 [Gelatoporia subvermispora B]|uniref:Uncharacterized protein n=1 Tax=Ceriporiopsis subvermispora (strain B) TaxID=914234 RepID=M2R325_CERS8|nr:hypothetical protein CERSUDRAFT_67981 [Gelatoporia subvermispora B]
MAGELSQAHEIRITGHGKIEAWVAFALRFFQVGCHDTRTLSTNAHSDDNQENESKPLTLHTLPAKKAQTDTGTENTRTDAEPPVPETQELPEPNTEKSRMAPSMSTIPRLVSVVEIIKREYLKSLDPELAESGSLSGLHQYNEVGELEDDQANGEDALVAMLSGKRHLRQHKVAYMKVTLCRQELPHLVAAGATYQQPDKRKLSKSAKARLKKKLKMESAADSAEE